jgi:hypothetical protein
MISEEEVEWAAAWRIIAIVKHIHTVWNGAVEELPGKTVRLHQLPYAILCDADNAIAIPETMFLPFPTTVGHDLDVVHQSLHRFDTGWHFLWPPPEETSIAL